MILNSEQVKGKIKYLANKENTDPRILLRIFMMERFLERLSISKYKTNFIIKGGILVTSLIGVNKRSTLDIDTTIKNINLDIDSINTIMNELILININDNISFSIKKIEIIMDNFEYPGIRVNINASLEDMIIPFVIDISTDDAITPKEIEYQYNLLLENRNINILSYNIETILSEKFQTILSRGILNTRMRDFYDIYNLTNIYKDKIDWNTFKLAFKNTINKRNTKFENINQTISDTINAENIINLWNKYQQKYDYAKNVKFEEVVSSLLFIASKI